MTIDISNLFLKIAVAVLAGILVCIVAFGAIKKASYDKQLTAMANAIALRDSTIEVQKGVYDKLAIQKDDLQTLLNERDTEIVALKKQLEKTSQELLTANKLVVQWKKAYEGAVAANQITIPSANGDRIQVNFEKDWGYIGVKGWTKTNPPEAWVSVSQNRPLKVAVVVSQDDKKVWHSYATSSEDNVAIDIQLSGVNPYMLAPKWYDKIAITGMLGIGKDLGNGGDLTGILGIGATVGIKQFDLGPFVAFHIGNTMDPIIGLQVGYRPFQ